MMQIEYHNKESEVDNPPYQMVERSTGQFIPKKKTNQPKSKKGAGSPSQIGRDQKI